MIIKNRYRQIYRYRYTDIEDIDIDKYRHRQIQIYKYTLWAKKKNKPVTQNEFTIALEVLKIMSQNLADSSKLSVKTSCKSELNCRLRTL